MSRAPFLAFLLAAGLTPTFAVAQDPASGLEMLGLAPGLAQGDLQDRIAKLGGKLSCRASTVDKRFAECTATVNRTGRTWDVLASTVDGTSGVILLKTSIASRDLERMRTDLTGRLGRPNIRRQGNQQSYEWVKSGRMMRLTARTEKGAMQLSVSLVEGSVLDALNTSR